MLRAAAIVLLSVLAAGAPDELSELSARLRDPRISYSERLEVERRLIALGEGGAKAVLKQLEGSFQDLDGRFRKAEKRYLADLEKEGRRAIEARLDKKGAEEGAKLRAEVAELRRREDLTKQEIVRVGDPASRRLAELLEIAPDPARERSPALGEARIELGRLATELEDVYSRWERCNAALAEGKRSAALASPLSRWDEFLAAEDWACVLATPMSKTDRDVLEANRALLASFAEVEEHRGILELNRLRIRLGLAALAIDLKLCDAARDHSNDMRTLGFFAHESPVPGKRTPGERASRFGTSCSGENIAMGHATGASAIVGWWYSPGHHKNMLAGHGRVALGRSESHWTQMFG